MIKFSIIASRLRRAQILTAGRGLSLYLYDPTTPTSSANPRQPPKIKIHTRSATTSRFIQTLLRVSFRVVNLSTLSWSILWYQKK